MTARRAQKRTTRRAVALLAVVLLVAAGCEVPPPTETDCVASPVACENELPGSPPSEWDISGTGDSSLEGFASPFSVDVGERVDLKVATDARSYAIDIYRLGWYGGDGARKVGSTTPSAPLPQNQPACLQQPETGLVDCGNWGVSASWTVPADAVSGVYLAHLVRPDTGGDNHIVFVVRDDASASDLLFQTSDTTWQAYNTWGGNSLYSGQPAGRAYKVSYNRPFDTRAVTPDGRDFVFSSEYPMIRFLERNGYDISYTSGADTDRRGAELLEHEAFLSVGHDEYWSGTQRTNVEAARDAGVDLAFFSGNEVYWKTRWEPSIDGSGASHRTLVSYKETRAGQKIDPSPEWTGTWRDARLSPPYDGGRPENALTGTLFKVNCCSAALEVPAADGKLRFWRGTGVDTLSAGQVATMPFGTLGYEWDEDVDNGHRPPGLFRLSTTTETVPQYLIDEGNTVVPHDATHHLTMYRAASGALVFGAGTIQWSWGLDAEHDGDGGAADPRMQQATVNLLADMGAQPSTIQPGLRVAAPSTDTVAPTLALTSPAAGAAVTSGTHVTVSGTAADVGGAVAGVEVSTDGGTSWHPASGRASWTYQWDATGFGPVTLLARAIDDSGNIQPTPASVTVDVACPCSVFGTETPTVSATTDPNAVELGMRFRPEIDGWATGVRFYKGPGNTGTHVGTLWSQTGTALATATATNETAEGWQQIDFSSPVALVAGTTYVVSYFAPAGHYAADAQYFRNGPTVRPPLVALQNGDGGPNGVFRYGSRGFPTDSYAATNYWVDVVVSTVAPPDLGGATATAVSPLAGSSSVPTATDVVASFDEAVDPATIAMSLRTADGNAVAAAVTYDAATRTVRLRPGAPLAPGTTYTAAVEAARDLAGNPLAAPASWSFTTARPDAVPGECPCSFWNDDDVPAIPSAADTSAVELGMRFRPDTDGTITAVRFYKGPANGGTHVGSIWSSAGVRLATGTFTGESTAGWQQLDLATPLAVTAGTTYTVSYHAPQGGYSATPRQFQSAGLDRPPLHAPPEGDGGNGVFRYGASGFPTASVGGNYWVDVVFERAPDTGAPVLVSQQPPPGAISVPVTTSVTAGFDEPLAPGSAQLTLEGPAGQVAGALTAPSPSSVGFTPAAPLQPATTYRARVSGAADAAGNVAPTSTWTFTTSGIDACPCTLFASTDVPAVAAAADTNAVELGTRFTAEVDGLVTGARFYKGPGNTGTHVANLWSATGTLLASVPYTSETTTGWQQVAFPTPVAITAGTTYVVSYHAPVGRYSVDLDWFTGRSTVNAPLLAPADAAGARNGVFAYGPGGFPSSGYRGSNYWVDVVFTPSNGGTP